MDMLRHLINCRVIIIIIIIIIMWDFNVLHTHKMLEFVIQVIKSKDIIQVETG